MGVEEEAAHNQLITSLTKSLTSSLKVLLGPSNRDTVSDYFISLVYKDFWLDFLTHEPWQVGRTNLPLTHGRYLTCPLRQHDAIKDSLVWLTKVIWWWLSLR